MRHKSGDGFCHMRSTEELLHKLKVAQQQIEKNGFDVKWH